MGGALRPACVIAGRHVLEFSRAQSRFCLGNTVHELKAPLFFLFQVPRTSLYGMNGEDMSKDRMARDSGGNQSCLAQIGFLLVTPKIRVWLFSVSKEIQDAPNRNERWDTPPREFPK